MNNNFTYQPDDHTIKVKKCHCNVEKTNWCIDSGKVTITLMELKIRFWHGWDDFSAGLNLYFDNSWDVETNGIIYTSKLFLKEFREYLKVNYNFSDEAVKDLYYSESGMQGDDYVNFDVGDLFYKEFINIPEIAKKITFS